VTESGSEGEGVGVGVPGLCAGRVVVAVVVLVLDGD
jgi:hypothetical protein